VYRTIRRANVHIRFALILRKLRMTLQVKERKRERERERFQTEPLADCRTLCISLCIVESNGFTGINHYTVNRRAGTVMKHPVRVFGL
jgi:hypothetical protein